jgi:hypothetical protein
MDRTLSRIEKIWNEKCITGIHRLTPNPSPSLTLWRGGTVFVICFVIKKTTNRNSSLLRNRSLPAILLSTVLTPPCGAPLSIAMERGISG